MSFYDHTRPPAILLKLGHCAARNICDTIQSTRDPCIMVAWDLGCFPSWGFCFSFINTCLKILQIHCAYSKLELQIYQPISEGTDPPHRAKIVIPWAWTWKSCMYFWQHLPLMRKKCFIGAWCWLRKWQVTSLFSPHTKFDVRPYTVLHVHLLAAKPHIFWFKEAGSQGR